MKDNSCIRFDHLDKDNQPVYKPKIRYDSEKCALEKARELNHRYAEQGKLIHKLDAYKCYKCGGWHIGRNSVSISEKNLNKILNNLNYGR